MTEQKALEILKACKQIIPKLAVPRSDPELPEKERQILFEFKKVLDDKGTDDTFLVASKTDLTSEEVILIIQELTVQMALDSVNRSTRKRKPKK